MTEEQFNNLPVADKLAKLANNIWQQNNNDKQNLGMEDFKRIFPGIEKQ